MTTSVLPDFIGFDRTFAPGEMAQIFAQTTPRGIFTSMYEMAELIRQRNTERSFGVVIGRFQAPRLTAGHIALLSHASDRHNKNLIVLIGDRSSPATATNPLSFELRRQMVEDEFPEAIVLRLMDDPYHDVWSNRVDAMIEDYAGDCPVIMYAGRDSFKPWYLGKYPVEEVEFDIECSATDAREGLTVPRLEDASDEIKYAFRAGVIHSMQTLWHRTYHTVDMALVRYNKLNGIEVLLVQKAGDVDKNIWRLPGGFVDKGETFERAADRETREETGLRIEGNWKFAGDFMIDDWRLRGAKGVDHKTVLMLGEVDTKAMKPVASDDIVNAQWKNLYAARFTGDEVFGGALKNRGRSVVVADLHKPLIDAVYDEVFANGFKETLTPITPSGEN